MHWRGVGADPVVVAVAVTDAEVVPIRDRLGEIRRQAGVFAARRSDVEAVREEYGETADAFRRFQLAVATADATRTPRPDPDPETERAGALAVDRLERAFEAQSAAYDALVAAIGQAIGEQVLEEGDAIDSPRSPVPLTVAQVRYPTEGSAEERALGEVTLTADGLRIEHERHNLRLGDDGRPVVEEVEPVRFERWWQGGLRIGGTVHPTSRRVVDVD